MALALPLTLPSAIAQPSLAQLDALHARFTSVLTQHGIVGGGMAIVPA